MAYFAGLSTYRVLGVVDSNRVVRSSINAMGSMDTSLMDGGVKQQHDVTRLMPMPVHTFNGVFGHSTSSGKPVICVPVSRSWS